MSLDMTQISEEKKKDSDINDDSDKKSMGKDESKDESQMNGKGRLWFFGIIGFFAVTTIVFMVLFIICVTNKSDQTIVYEAIEIELESNASINVSTESGHTLMIDQGTSLFFLPDKSAQGIELKKPFHGAPKANIKTVPEYVKYKYNPCNANELPWLNLWSGIVFAGNKNLIRVETDVIIPYPPSGPEDDNINWEFQVWNLGMQPTAIGPSIGVNTSYQNACTFQGANDTSYINSGHFHRLRYLSNNYPLPATFNSLDRSGLSGQWLWTQSMELAQTDSIAYGSFLNRSTFGMSMHTTMIEQSNEVWVTSMQLNHDPLIVKTMGFNQSLWKNVLQHNYQPGSFQYDLLYSNSWKFGMVPYFFQSITTQPKTLEDIPRFWPNVTKYENVSIKVEDNAGLTPTKLMYSPEITGKLFDGNLFLNNEVMNEYITAQESNATETFPFQKCVASCVNAWANGIKIYNNGSENVYNAIVQFENSVESTLCDSGVCRVDPSECTFAYWTDFCSAHPEYEWCSQYTT